MEPIDVLIVTAVAEEYAAVLLVDTGAIPGSVWEEQADLSVRFRDFKAAGGGRLRVAVTQALGMGGANAAIASASLIQVYGVQCLAMCGVCAGRKGDVALGDVIVAERVWQYDTGKRKAEGVGGERVVKEEGDIEMYRLHPPAWKTAAQRFAERFEIDPKPPWLKLRPRSYEAQGDWILERVLRGVPDPGADPDSKTKCADFEKAIERLWKKELLEPGTRTLTEAGRKHIETVLLRNQNELPEAKPLRVYVDPIASGNRVMQDDEVFALLATSVRKVLGVDMEAAAIGALAYAEGLPFSVVMKAVMDHADADKSDNFKEFAARASAECLIAFVLQHVPPRKEKWRDDWKRVLKENPDAKAIVDKAHRETEALRNFYRDGARGFKKLGPIFLVLGVVGALLSALLDLPGPFFYMLSAYFLFGGIHFLVMARQEKKKAVEQEAELRIFPRSKDE